MISGQIFKCSCLVRGRRNKKRKRRRSFEFVFDLVVTFLPGEGEEGGIEDWEGGEREDSSEPVLANSAQ